MRRLMLVALAVGTAVAMAGTAGLAGPAGTAVPKGGKGCVVQYVDERGEVRETKTEPEGTVRGEFRCVGGVWQYSFDREESITAPRLQIGPEGKLTAPEFVRPARARDLTLGEMADIMRVVRGAREAGMFVRAVVAVDDGKERTPEEVEAILAGKDTTGAKILRTFDRLDQAMTVQDVVGETGTSEPVVVYFLSGIWDAIVDAVNWVIDGVNDVIDWIDDHCQWFPPPPPLGTVVTCQW